jgi:hypothetical protein
MFKNVINVFISFIFMIAFSHILCIITSFIVLSNDNFYLTNINQVYYSFTAQKINNGMQSIELASGIDSSAFNNIITGADVKNALKSEVKYYISFFVKNTLPVIKYESINAKIRDRLTEYALSNGLNLNIKTKADIETVVVQCNAVFKNNLIQIPYFLNIITFMKALQRLIKFLFVFVIICMVIFICSLFLLNRASKKNIVRYLFYSIFSSGIFTGLCTIFLSMTGYTYKLKFDEAIVRNTVGDILTAYFNTLTIAAFSVSIIAVILFLLSTLLKFRD